ncbi:MAG: class I SAM-dependent methyltransferase [Ignavibacteria bacterium]|nr:class I SAM-dependent methyltransferase [Ignavibacteria bacterium]
MDSYYNKEVSNCYFCQSDNFIEHSKATYWKIIELNFFECKNCGLIFANPMPSLDIIIKGNKALNVLHTSRGTFSQYKGGKEFTFVLKKICRKGTLLDVGCAEGLFLKGIEDFSEWKAEGIDVIESAVTFSNNRLGVKVYFGVLESMKNPDNTYDYIRMNNVIEHVQNPVSFIKKANSLLKNGGIVYISTPNGIQDGAVLKTANKQGTIINLLENHFFYYKPKTLKNILKSCGFRIIKSYCEDIKHSIKDFGLFPWIKIRDSNEKYSLNDYTEKENTDFQISDDEINNMKYDKSLNSKKLLFNLYFNRFFKIKIPSVIPIGHQQVAVAEKIKEVK